MIRAGATLPLDIEKPAAGGRMLARHQGQVVLVAGAVPGERVEARVERVGKGVAFAAVTRVLAASPDRRSELVDWRCGGNVFAHIAYERQVALKGQIIQDAFGRIGRMPMPAPPVIPSPEAGYRMRARVHVDGHRRIGFFREGSHEICDAAATGQLLPTTLDWIRHAGDVLRRRALSGLAAIEIAENVAADQRACHLDLASDVDPAAFAELADGVTGLSAQPANRPRVTVLAGEPRVTDLIAPGDDRKVALKLGRDVRAFFQGNRHLLQTLVDHVRARVPDGPIVDLYAGVGLFGLSLAASRSTPVIVVEGDPISGADLARNAEPFADRVSVWRSSVEAFLAESAATTPATAGRRSATFHFSDSTFVVDPPRTGMSREALASIIAAQPHTIVYVSCDVATLARDARTLADAGYELGDLTGIDLFPNTAHVESMAVLARSRGNS